MKLVNCPKCNGTGRVKTVPYYANPMPKEIEQGCEECGGRGKFQVISEDYYTITEGLAKQMGLLK